MGRIAEVKISQVKFDPGDRLLARVHQRLTTYDQEKLKRVLQNWAGPGVEILIIDGREMEISLDKQL